MKDFPPAPPGWNKTVDDLFSEQRSGLRKSIGAEEFHWASIYERSLLPGGVRFPRKDDVYEASQDMEVQYMTSWFAPYTGGGVAILKQGERIIVQTDCSNEEPLSVYALPEQYKDLEMRMVSEDDRTHYKYSNFYLCVKTLDLNTKFRLVTDGGAQE
ncbi:MAG: hypothetical protein ABSC93_06055 [Bryobacteraceae bacterium]|jgi:hypothetical protein